MGTSVSPCLLHLLLEHLPELDGFVVGADEEPRAVGALVAPPQRVDLLLNLQTLQIVELREAGERAFPRSDHAAQTTW